MNKGVLSRSALLTLSIVAVGFFAVNCGGGGDDIVGSGEDVTVSGTIVDIDNAFPAEGLKVCVLDSDVCSTTPSDENGAFTLQVPAGSKYLLWTEDFDETVNGWFPLINQEIVTPTIDADTTDILIHACPITSGTEKGTVAATDNFLANGSEKGRFNTTTAAASGGIIGVLFVESNGGVFGLTPGMSMTTDDTAFPIGYIQYENFYDDALVPDPALGPDAIYPVTQTGTDGSGTVYAIGDSSFEGDSVNVTFTDTDTTRALNFGEPIEVPVRKGTLTVLIPGSIDGVAGKGYLDVLVAGGII